MKLETDGSCSNCSNMEWMPILLLPLVNRLGKIFVMDWCASTVDLSPAVLSDP